MEPDYWIYPTRVPHVTSSFGLRTHPVTGVRKMHWGTDFRAPTGTALLAANAGTVVKSVGGDPVAGNYVRIDAGGGVWIGYSHLSRRDVKVGDRVKAGDVIGLSGATGSATAAHLHFEVSINGVKVDPAVFLAQVTAPSVPLPPTDPQPPAPAPVLEDSVNPIFMQTTAETNFAVYMIIPGQPKKHVDQQTWALYSRLGFKLEGGPYLLAEVDLLAQHLGG